MAVENIQHNTFVFTFPINNSIKKTVHFNKKLNI